MVRYKQTHEILKLIGDRTKVRNIGIIAHVDHGKCVSGDTIVSLGDGRLIRISKLFFDATSKEYGAFPLEVTIPSFDYSSKKIVSKFTSHIWRLKKSRLIRVTLRNGFKIEVTPEHPFYTMTESGLIKPLKASDIKVGDYILVPGKINIKGNDFSWFKKVVVNWILNKNDFYVYLNETMRFTLADKIRKYGVKRIYKLGIGSSYKMILDSIKYGRFRGSDLARIIDIIKIDKDMIYDSILYIGYKGNKGRFGGRLSKFSLPKNEEELEAAMYVVGLLYGDGSSSCSFNNSDEYMIKLYKRSLWNAFKIGITITKDKTTNRVIHRGGKAFEYFMREFFKYPSKKKSRSLDLPNNISMLDNRYVAAFLRGLFDTDGTIEQGRSAISLLSASHNLIYKVAYLLQRYGILPILRRKGKYMITYITGDDVKKFGKSIGFRNLKKISRFKTLTSKTKGARVGEYIPVSPSEIKTMRICIGLSSSDTSIPYFSYYETGRERMTRKIFGALVKEFASGLETKAYINKMNIVKKALKSDKPRFSRKELGILRSLSKDGVLVKYREKYILTEFGEEILKVWNKISDGNSSANDNINTILENWKLIANDDIRFVKVTSVESKKGDFEVYDLTVPQTHTFIANGIIVHNTTLTDSLLAASGLLSPTVAGEARALDYLEEEQKRGITIKTANISLLHKYNGSEYVINLIDTPGHVDFTGKVTRALRAIDGAVVVVDAVEEVMVQTETVTRQALEERVKPILFINKVDRLITELRLGPKDIQKKLARIISRFNRLIEIFAEEQFRDKWPVRPELNNVAFGSAKDRWGFTLKQAQEKNMTFNDVLKFYEEGRLDELRKLLPIHKAVLDMVIEHIPTPIEAQRYRIPKIWKGDLNSEIGKAMISCDENGPVAFMVTNVMVDEKAGLVATGRLLSGTLKSGLEVYLINKGKKDRVLQVGMYMGPYREVVDHMIAGNIPAVLGLEDASAGETVTTISNMYPFEAIHYISEPVVTISIEPKNTRDLPKLINALRKLAIEDPNLHVKINEETGEYLLSGMGTLHLEVSLHFLADMGIEVSMSSPIVVYRESITKKSPIFPGKSPNKHNKVKVRLEKLDDEIIDMIVSGELNERLGRKEIQRILMDKGWSAEEARSVWAIDNESGNILIDMTKGVQYMQESKQMLIGAFFDFCKEGALAREPLRGVKTILIDAVFHEDPAHRTLAQIVPMLHRALLGAELAAEPSLYEPIMKIQVQVPTELIGAVTGVLASKRGQVTNIDQREYYSVVNGFIPVSETFDLAQVLRGATAGRAFWQTQFNHWQLIPKSLLSSVVSEIRKRKGLPENPPSYRDFIPPGEQIEK